jgi:TetR/AcrR family acrAB operon transcriptional repressor
VNKRSAEISRQNILDTAMRVFADHGYAQANMRTIALAAGISVGGVYLYFKSKEELYLTLMEQWIEDLNQRTTAALAETDNPSEALRTFITISLDFALSHKDVLLQGKETGICGGNMMLDFFRRRRIAIEEIIAAGIAAGSFSACSASETARVIFCTLRGFFVSLSLDDDALFSSDVCVSLLLNGLLARNPATDTR